MPDPSRCKTKGKFSKVPLVKSGTGTAGWGREGLRHRLQLHACQEKQLTKPCRGLGMHQRRAGSPYILRDKDSGKWTIKSQH